MTRESYIPDPGRDVPGVAEIDGLQDARVPRPGYVINHGLGAGQIRYTQVGEGNHGRTETAIRALLAEALDSAVEPEAAENLRKE